jgi:hypothetical protein
MKRFFLFLFRTFPRIRMAASEANLIIHTEEKTAFQNDMKMLMASMLNNIDQPMHDHTCAVYALNKNVANDLRRRGITVWGEIEVLPSTDGAKVLDDYIGLVPLR